MPDPLKDSRLRYNACRSASLPAGPALFAAWLATLAPAIAQTAPAPDPALRLGDMVVTRFAGKRTLERPDPPGRILSVADRMVLDPEGIAAQYLRVARPGYIWDGRVWPQESVFSVPASKVGQVFGVTLDDAEPPNVYLAATSFYGLPLVAADPAGPNDGLRLRTGAPGARFMPALFGPGGGPGSIWRVDGRTGAVTLFADLKLDGQPNHGPALGNIAFDPASRQIFATDLATGMIHRIGLDGSDRGAFDHGVAGRTAGGLPPVPFDPAGRASIQSPGFDTLTPASWGMARSERRVHGVAIHRGRVYYAVDAQSAIWSVALTPDGAFGTDARFEIALPEANARLAGSDLVFTSAGQMIVAQRGAPLPGHGFESFAQGGTARVYRFRLKTAGDPPSPGLWFPEPGEYPVGFAGEGRNTTGGLDLGYGYNRKGEIDLRACEAALWTTGENLRNEPSLKRPLEAGGPMVMSGVQGIPSGPVKGENAPPWTSYMVDVLERALPDPFPGEIGDVAVYRKPCGAEVTARWAGPRPIRTFYGGPGGGYPYGPDHTWSPPDTWDPPPNCIVPGLCPPPPPRACLDAMPADLSCDRTTGEWVLPVAVGTQGNFTAIRATTGTIGVAVSGGPVLPLLRPMGIRLTGLAPGKVATIDLCGYDAAAAAGGKPYDCCKATVVTVTPPYTCEKY